MLLIGDSSHVTSEFYSVPTEITKYMIAKHGFSIVAVEADWPDTEHVDDRHRPGPGEGTAEATQTIHSGEQNTRIVKDAENYYKAMYRVRYEAWNLLVAHMSETLERIRQHRGTDTKAIVWAHSSHIGDARATSMGLAKGEINIGQICKEKFGHMALSIGTGTYSGSVTAAEKRDGDLHIMKVQPGLLGSYEELMHATGIGNFILDLREGQSERRLVRFIGVLYKTKTEKASHYSYTSSPEQFDEFICFDESRPVRPWKFVQSCAKALTTSRLETCEKV
ncbi:erythromycin esterase-domain-containing protein [Fusarium avenaceum]|nr:erythromycin esterase-domain-containing protein [Fusarium avenaceum]